MAVSINTIVSGGGGGGGGGVQTITAGTNITNTGTATNPILNSTAGGGNALTSNPLSQFAATTSAQLAGVISDETGTGALVFGTAPTLSNPVVGTQTALDNSTKAASTAYVDTAVALVAPNAPVVLTGATTLVNATHANRLLVYNSASGAAITINGSTGYTLDGGNRIMQVGAGVATLTASGITFANPYSLSLVTTGVGSWIDFEFNATLGQYVITATGSGGGSAATDKKFRFTFANQAGSYFNDPINQTLAANFTVVGTTITWEGILHRISGTVGNITLEPNVDGASGGATVILPAANNFVSFEVHAQVISSTQLAISYSGAAAPYNTAVTVTLPALVAWNLTTTHVLGMFLNVAAGDTARLIACSISVSNPN